MMSAPGFLALCLLVSLWLAVLQPAAAETAQPVGRVTTLIGEAVVENRLRKDHRQVMEKGMAVLAGDRLRTAEGGVVHIRFIDGGLVSLRPQSLLVVDRYQFDEDEPRNSLIRFKLEEGTLRTISGQGAKAARDRFRLNTPIAAIGVRGTDFVVRAGGDRVRAVVNEGAIVVAPYSASCPVDSFGPCHINGVELSGLMQQMVEVTAGAAKPRLVPLDESLIPGMIDQLKSEEAEDSSQDDASGENDSAASSESGDAGSGAPGGGGEAGTEGAGNTESGGNPPGSGESAGFEPGKSADWYESRDEIIEFLDGNRVRPENFMPREPVPVAELNQRQLVWGRWSAEAQPLDRIVAPRDAIIDGRSVAVGNVTHVLYRSDTQAGNRLAQLPRIRFGLVDAQASLMAASGPEAMAVRDGWLEIDFGAGSFATALSLSHQRTGTLGWAAEGQVNDKGFFNVRTPDSRMVGAASFDGTEAAYQFSQDHPEGDIEGLTFWRALR